MIKMQPNKSGVDWTGWVSAVPRIVVGLVLVSTGIGKGLDIAGFVTVLDSYQLQPHWASVALAYTLPFIELGTGVCLLRAVQRIATAWVAIGLHILMISVVAVTLIRGISVPNCGCFGVFLARPLTVITLIEDAVMLTLSILVLLDAKNRAGALDTFVSDESSQQR